jgi:ABC-type dipeptide/oligopeptide/nickel transport system ATPase component
VSRIILASEGDVSEYQRHRYSIPTPKEKYSTSIIISIISIGGNSRDVISSINGRSAYSLNYCHVGCHHKQESAVQIQAAASKAMPSSSTHYHVTKKRRRA